MCKLSEGVVVNDRCVDIFFAVGGVQPKPKTPEEIIVEKYQRYPQLWANHDAKGLANMYAEDGILMNSIASDDVTGRKGMSR